MQRCHLTLPCRLADVSVAYCRHQADVECATVSKCTVDCSHQRNEVRACNRVLRCGGHVVTVVHACGHCNEVHDGHIAHSLMQCALRPCATVGWDCRRELAGGATCCGVLRPAHFFLTIAYHVHPEGIDLVAAASAAAGATTGGTVGGGHSSRMRWLASIAAQHADCTLSTI